MSLILILTGVIMIISGIVVFYIGKKKAVPNNSLWAIIPIFHGLHEFAEFLESVQAPFIVERFGILFAISSSFLLLAAALEYNGVISRPTGKLTALIGIITVSYFIFTFPEDILEDLAHTLLDFGFLQSTIFRFFQGFLMTILAILAILLTSLYLLQQSKKSVLTIDSKLIQTTVISVILLSFYAFFEGFIFEGSLEIFILFRAISISLFIVIPLFFILEMSDASFFSNIEKFQLERKLMKSKEKYRILLETSSMGLLEIDIKSRKFSYINPRFLEIIGYPVDELNSYEFIIQNIYPEDIQKIFETTEEKNLEFRIYDKNKRLKWLSGARLNQYNEEGDLIGIKLWLADVTEKKLHENLVYELGNNFLHFKTDVKKNIHLLLNTLRKLLIGDIVLHVQKIFQDDSVLIQIISSDNDIIYYDYTDFKGSRFINELFEGDNHLPRTILNLNTSKYANTDKFIKKYNIKGYYGKIIEFQNDFESLVCILYRKNPIISDQDQLVLLLVSDAIKIEERRWQMLQKLEKQNINLKEISKFKSDLLQRTSHELKTPLISIKGFSNLLLELHYEKFDIETTSILKEINRGCEKLEMIINILIESSKIETEKIKINLSKEDLSFLIKFCVSKLRGLANSRNLSIYVDIYDKINIKMEKEKIQDVILNLLTNAIKNTPPNGKIKIKSEIKDNFIIISIEDNGIGITKEEKKHLFKQLGKIERYGQGWDIGIDGIGLGLFISKIYVELHGGSIWVESEGRNKGSIFLFSLPVIND